MKNGSRMKELDDLRAFVGDSLCGPLAGYAWKLQHHTLHGEGYRYTFKCVETGATVTFYMNRSYVFNVEPKHADT